MIYFIGIIFFRLCYLDRFRFQGQRHIYGLKVTGCILRMYEEVKYNKGRSSKIISSKRVALISWVSWSMCYAIALLTTFLQCLSFNHHCYYPVLGMLSAQDFLAIGSPVDSYHWHSHQLWSIQLRSQVRILTPKLQSMVA